MLHPDTLTLTQAFADSGVRTWLIGGNAIELLCGNNIRDHDDIDFMVETTDSEKALTVLTNLGFLPAHGTWQQGNVFYRRGELVVDLVPVLQHPPRCLGDLSALALPAEFLNNFTVVYEGTVINTITPAMHKALKDIVAAFYGSGLREKDRIDLAALAQHHL